MPRVARLRAAPRRAPEPVPRFHPGPPLARPPRRRAIEGEPLLRRRRARLATAARAADGARVAPRAARGFAIAVAPLPLAPPPRVRSARGLDRRAARRVTLRAPSRKGPGAARGEQDRARGVCGRRRGPDVRGGGVGARHRSQPELPRRVAEAKSRSCRGCRSVFRSVFRSFLVCLGVFDVLGFLVCLSLVKRLPPRGVEQHRRFLPRAVDVRHPAPRRVQPRVGRDARDEAPFRSSARGATFRRSRRDPHSAPRRVRLRRARRGSLRASLGRPPRRRRRGVHLLRQTRERRAVAPLRVLPARLPGRDGAPPRVRGRARVAHAGLEPRGGREAHGGPRRRDRGARASIARAERTRTSSGRSGRASRATRITRRSAGCTA